MADIVQTFKNLRIFSMNIVNHFTKIREISSFGVISGKYDFAAIKTTYHLDHNYLLKMKEDTDFLYLSNLNRYFCFSMDSDPFLVALSENKLSDKAVVPLTDEMLQSIRASQFILLQELIYYEVNKASNKFEDILLPPRRDITSAQRRKKDLKPILITKSPDIRGGSSVNKAKPLSQHLLSKKDTGGIKLRNMELITKDLNDHEVISEKSKLDTVELKRNIKIDVQSLKITKEVLQTPKHDLSIISTKSKKHSKKMNENMVVNDSKINIQTVNTEEAKRTGSELHDTVSQKPLNDSLDMKSLCEKPIPQLSNDMPQYSIAKEDIEHFDSSLCNFKFYTDNISKFSDTYVSYLANISEEQKIIFNISDKLLDNLKGISPKLILITYGAELVGLSIAYNDVSNESKVRLVLSHFSTVYFRHYYMILLNLMEFFKLNFVFHEIFVELHYGYRDDKYYINPQISEIIAKKMKFRWITLENSGVDRKVKYRLPNPSCETTMDLYSFCLEFVVVVSLQDKINSPGSIRYVDKENDINLFPFLYVLSEMSNQHDYSVSTEGFGVFNSDKLRVSYLLNIRK
jgi:hypothetical protein